MGNRKPLDSQAAMADGVDHLLRQYKHLGTKAGEFGTWSPTVASNVTGGTVPTLFIASSEAMDHVKEMANFVCSGADDQIEIIAALQALDDAMPSWGSGGRILLSGGTFYVSDRIYWSLSPLSYTFAGMGMDSTRIETTADASILRAGVVDLTGYDLVVRDVTISCFHDNYAASLVADSGGTSPGLVDRVEAGFQPPTETNINGAIALSSDMTIKDSLAYGEGYGIYCSGIRTVIDNVKITEATTRGGGQGDGIYFLNTNAHDARVVKCHISGVAGHAIRTYNDRGIFIGNNAPDGILFEAAATDNVYGGNIGLVTDNGVDNVSFDNALIEIADLSVLTTKGDLWGYDTADNRIPVGADETMLTADSSTALGVKYGHPIEEVRWATLPGVTLSILDDLHRIYAEVDMTIVDFSLSVGGTPSGGPATIDIHRDGTSNNVFTTQANRPSVAAASFYDGGAVPDVTAVSAGSYLTVHIDAANSATDAIVTMRWRKA